MSKISLLFRRAPYGTVNDIEGFRLCTALASMEIETNAVFIDDGVYAMTRGQKPQEIGLPSAESACEKLTDFNVKIYVLEEALKKRGIKQEDLIKTDYKLIDRHEMARLISESDITIAV